jgi:N-acetylmuramoyl-L-alanine amidase
LRPELVVIHYTAMHSADAALQRLCDPRHEVSAHYLIAQDGAVTQMVPEDLRAWHAGTGHWMGHDDINSRSIGIELDNDGQGPFAEAQMRSLETLIRDLLHRWSIPPQGVIGHSDMAPDRKFDPGPYFDWTRLEAAGLAGLRGTGAGPRTAEPETFRHLARAAGYTADVTDDALLHAVRLRYRPQVTGPLTPEDYIPLVRA